MRLPLLIVILGWNAMSLSAQELEPRAYSPAPIGTKFLIAGFGGSKGSILLDPSLDVAGVQADLHITTVGGGYTFDLGGRQARLLAVLPIAWGKVTGEVEAKSAVRTSPGWPILASSFLSDYAERLH